VTAKRVRERIETVLTWAEANKGRQGESLLGYRTRNIDSSSAFT
jgi:hypothetical protein